MKYHHTSNYRYIFTNFQLTRTVMTKKLSKEEKKRKVKRKHLKIALNE